MVDDRAARARLQEANAAIAEARAAIGEAQTAQATAQQQLDLYASIDDPAAVSRSEVIRAQGDASAAGSRLELARARLAAAKARGTKLGNPNGAAALRRAGKGNGASVASTKDDECSVWHGIGSGFQ